MELAQAKCLLSSLFKAATNLASLFTAVLLDADILLSSFKCLPSLCLAFMHVCSLAYTYVAGLERIGSTR